MNKKWVIIEKVIGFLITAWGMYTLYSVVSTLYGMISGGMANSTNLTYLKLLQTNHLNILLSVASIFGGMFLVFGEKKGWLISLLCSSMYAVILFMSATANRNDIKQTNQFFYQSYSVTAILFLITVVLLLQKPIRGKYRPTAKNWRTIGLLFIVLLADKILL